jgi:DNA mismatch repair protein MutH
MTAEMKVFVNARRILLEACRPAPGKQAAIADESMATTEEICVRRGHVNERLRGVAAIKASGVVPLARLVGSPIMIIPTEQENLSVSVHCGHESGMDGNYIVRRDGRTPRHTSSSRNDPGIR